MSTFTSVLRAVLGTAALLLLASPSGAASLTTVYSFHGGHDGAAPEAALLDVNGILYGTTSAGGAKHHGTVFAFNPATSAETVVYSFAGGSDGESPYAALINVAGTLYGTTYLGGSKDCFGAGCGTVFTLNPTTGVETVLVSFNDFDGAFPLAAPLSTGGTVYGITSLGGTSGYGTVFDIHLSTGTEKVVHSFGGGSDGAVPYGALINLGPTLYGTTGDGGAADLGTVFTINSKTGAEAVLYSFAGGGDGAAPTAALLKVSGTLYGTTLAGGASGLGTVFAINPTTGAETVLHSFAGGSDGAEPDGGLLNVNGTLYGTTMTGGASGDGTLFSINPTTKAETVLYTFSGSDGAAPAAALIDVGGTLYGTTTAGGKSRNGTVFSFTP